MARNESGFSLIEILFVLMVIALLASISIPTYIGMKNKARTSAVLKSASTSIGDLQFWLQSSASIINTSRMVDTNFDGIVNENDLRNYELKDSGIAESYASGRNSGLKEKSPWQPDLTLWTTDSSIQDGRITLIQQTQQRVRIIAKDNMGKIIFDNMASVD